MVLILYISITRYSVDSFIDGYGLYGHTWAPWLEAILNLSFSLYLGFQFGVFGVLCGTLISLFFIVVLWKPFYLFMDGFKIYSISEYWKTVIGFYIISFIVYIVFDFINLQPKYVSSVYVNFFIHSLICFLLIMILNGLFMYVFSIYMRQLVLRVKNLLLSYLKVNF
jgi:hypothetical protein